MSTNRNRKDLYCACCGQRRPQRFSMFCEECWRNDPDGCRDTMGMEKYNQENPRPVVKVPHDAR